MRRLATAVVAAGCLSAGYLALDVAAPPSPPPPTHLPYERSRLSGAAPLARVEPPAPQTPAARPRRVVLHSDPDLRLPAATPVQPLPASPAPATAGHSTHPRAAGGDSHGGADKYDAALRQVAAHPQGGPVRVIVRTRPAARSGMIRALAEAGRHVRADHRLIGAFTTTIWPGDLDVLARHPAVERLSLDAPVGAQGEVGTSGQVLHATLGLKEGGGLLSGGRAWTGDGIGVAVIDSGIKPSADLHQSRIAAFYDFTRGGRMTRPYDDHGHGTHVAGLIGGSGRLSSDAYGGIAPEVTFVGYKVLDEDGAGYTSDVIAAVEHAIEHRAALGIDIINLSLGHPVYEPAASDPLVHAVERAVAAGIVVVVSAGNAGTSPGTNEIGYGGVTSPGNAPSAITVGALDMRDTVARADDLVTDFSSRGVTRYDLFPKPDLVAPGRHLVAPAAVGSMLYDDHPELRVAVHGSGRGRSAKYLQLSGTSMAAGITTGAVALMLEANRAGHPRHSIAPNAVKAILQFTAFDMGYDLLTQGAGALNASGAVRLADAIDVRAAAGQAWIGEWPLASDVIDGQPIPWAQRIIWGDRLVWGDTIYLNEPAWALRIVWGDRLVWGDRIVWGDRVVWGDTSSLVWNLRIVWGDRLIWGDRIVWGDMDPEVSSPGS